MADKSAEEDTDDEDDETHSIESPKPKVESIGPPKILQFKPEVKEVVELEAASPTFSIPAEPFENVSQFMHGFNVHVKGGDKCEFCEEITKPWPSISEQEEFSPEDVNRFLLVVLALGAKFSFFQNSLGRVKIRAR